MEWKKTVDIFFTGERSPNWNLDARGVFFGLGIEHNVTHLARALLEGATAADAARNT